MFSFIQRTTFSHPNIISSEIKQHILVQISIHLQLEEIHIFFPWHMHKHKILPLLSLSLSLSLCFFIWFQTKDILLAFGSIWQISNRPLIRILCPLGSNLCKRFEPESHGLLACSTISRAELKPLARQLNLTIKVEYYECWMFRSTEIHQPSHIYSVE